MFERFRDVGSKKSCWCLRVWKWSIASIWFWGGGGGVVDGVFELGLGKYTKCRNWRQNNIKVYISRSYLIAYPLMRSSCAKSLLYSMCTSQRNPLPYSSTKIFPASFHKPICIHIQSYRSSALHIQQTHFNIFSTSDGLRCHSHKSKRKCKNPSHFTIWWRLCLAILFSLLSFFQEEWWNDGNTICGRDGRCALQDDLWRREERGGRLGVSERCGLNTFHTPPMPKTCVLCCRLCCRRGLFVSFSCGPFWCYNAVALYILWAFVVFLFNKTWSLRST